VTTGSTRRSATRCATRTSKHWLSLAADIGVPSRVVDRLCRTVVDAVGQVADALTPEMLDMPESWVRDVRRRITRRVRDLEG
jgi:hypothetical protein